MNTRIKSVMVALILSVTSLTHAATYGGGSGTAEDPYQINAVADWQELANTPLDWNKQFILLNDIDFDNAIITPVGTVDVSFTGTLDGGDHVLRNFIINQPDGDCIGLFGKVGEFGRILNLGLENSEIKGHSYVGGLCGLSWGNAEIRECYSEGDVSGNQHYVGGLIGFNQVMVTACYSTGSVTGTGQSVGGLCGMNMEGTISKCYSSCSVSGATYSGGLAGYNYHGIISMCYARGPVAGDYVAGGLCGVNDTASIDQCYSTGVVTGNQSLGGLVGYAMNGSVTASFWDHETSGQTSSAGGSPLFTQWMKELWPYTNNGWDFVNSDGDPEDWILADQNYPILAWQLGIPLKGQGTPDDPFEIRSVEDWKFLLRVSSFWSRHFTLTSDIDFHGEPITPVAPDTNNATQGFQGITFSGVFEGNGHIIRNVYLDQQPSCDYMGLFGYFNGEIRNLNIINTVVFGRNHVGGLAGANVEGKIISCSVLGDVISQGEGSYVGGLAGSSDWGSITSSCWSGSVSGYQYVGGLVGSNVSTITLSCAKGQVSGTGDIIGGLCGVNNGSISQCYSTGSVSGRDKVGGLCGGYANSTISQCYSIGTVTGRNDVGGLAGYSSYQDEVTSSFWDIEGSGCTTSKGGIGLTTTQMKTRSTFIDAGWDFVESDGDPADWFMPNQDYPHLAWELGEENPKLVGWWKFDEGSGTIAYDSSGYNRHGTCIGNPVWVAGRVGGGLSFDGVDDYVELPIGDLVSTLSNCTLATWVNFSNTGGAWQRIFDFGTGTEVYMFLTPRLDMNGSMRFAITTGSYTVEQYIDAPSTLPSGWHHVAVTMDAVANTLALYLDGVEIARHTQMTLTPGDLGVTTQNWLGRSEYIADGYYSGLLDDFRIYNYPLTVAEVAALASEGVSDLVGWWTFDEGSGTTVYDSSGYNRHGTGVGNPAWAAGRIGGGLSFDGIDDYVELPIGDLVSTLSNCTFAAWVNFSNTGGAWQRIFDFGTGTQVYMFLTPRLDMNGPMRFAITTGGYTVEQYIDAPTLPTGWHHVAVSIDAVADTLTLYLDGLEIARKTQVTLTPSDLGVTTQNWLGRSEYAEDAYYSGLLDDFRIYNYPLTAAEVGYLVPYSGGAGTADDPYRISRLADFQELAETSSDWDKNFILINDIDFSGATLTPIAPDTDLDTFGFQGIMFTGIFDGGGHNLFNAVIDLSSVEYVGLFGCLGSEGQIYNLGLINASIRGEHYVGGLVGENCGVVTSCFVTGLVNGGSCIGGLVGHNIGTMNTCYAASAVSGNASVGGLVGFNDRYDPISGSITFCYATGSVNGIDQSSICLGGLIGMNNDGWISSCYATGSVKGGIVQSSSYLGGLIGANYGGGIGCCYATGSVSGYSDIGGLVGATYGSSTIYDCYATGSVHGIHTKGGLVGYVEYPFLHVSSFWDTQTSGQMIGVGYGSSEGIMGATTIQMQTLLLFTSAGWDFPTADGDPAEWFMPYHDYPRLSWEPPHTGGNGSAEYPYLIWTAPQMNAIGANSIDWSKHFKLMADIDMSAYTGIQYHIIGNATTPFTGSFDGNNHVIENLTYTTSESMNSVGLFGSISNATIKNLGVKNVTISSVGTYIGGLVGDNWYSTITSCYVTGSIQGAKFVGGLAGYMYTGILRDCYASGSVIGTDIAVGGLLGSSYGNTITNCNAASSVIGIGIVGGLTGGSHYNTVHGCHATGTVSGTEEIGGLAGRSLGGSLTSCYATGSVSGTSYEVGGLIGMNIWSTLTACYATGSVLGDHQVGGLVGYNDSALLSACYAAGPVQGITSYAIGGLVGTNYNGTISNCFWDIQASGKLTSEGGTGKTTSEMQTLSTFTLAGWDFTNETANGTDDYWRMCPEETDYPRLNWESMNGDFACPDGVDTEDLDYYVGQWLMMDCTPANNYCGGADLDYSGAVGLSDWVLFAGNWLKGE